MMRLLITLVLAILWIPLIVAFLGWGVLVFLICLPISLAVSALIWLWLVMLAVSYGGDL